MDNCLFCRIIKKEIPADIIFENDNLIIFKDIHPKAPVHLLIVPKKHIASVNDIVAEDKNIIGEIFLQAKEIAKKLKLDESGYRLIVNTGKNGGQVIFHIHCHLVGGKLLSLDL
ncbi:MAG: histidine triad nucleotide-binding protein [Patescibacteria group bacterium]|jgi:histidine triad (HIT) family protein